MGCRDCRKGDRLERFRTELRDEVSTIEASLPDQQARNELTGDIP